VPSAGKKRLGGESTSPWAPATLGGDCRLRRGDGSVAGRFDPVADHHKAQVWPSIVATVPGVGRCLLASGCCGRLHETV